MLTFQESVPVEALLICFDRNRLISDCFLVENLIPGAVDEKQFPLVLVLVLVDSDRLMRTAKRNAIPDLEFHTVRNLS